MLAAEGSKIGRRHVTTLMKRMGIEALYWRPRTTKPEPGHKIARQRLRRAAMAQRQIRGGISASLRQRVRGPHIARPQRPQTAHEP
jgi:hypothetical protein